MAKQLRSILYFYFTSGRPGRKKLALPDCRDDGFASAPPVPGEQADGIWQKNWCGCHERLPFKIKLKNKKRLGAGPDGAQPCKNEAVIWFL
ncbi:hypothetical protein GWJ21_06005 [Bacillus coagulans]|uniref:hypothetical protein n=1 Tax=Heyndrickxia coagulans TaxID=1398 RepID=UPI001378EA3C|nr:hypothetical protein [Heyndrickxia coagulans]NCG67517.1 hypothetical protein [Heyndrickxia coagulans]